MIANCKQSIIFILFICMSFLMSGCTPDEYYPFSSEPLNLSDFNSEYDDYNSAMPPTYELAFPLCFSSNRNSSFANFDIINSTLHVKYDMASESTLIEKDSNDQYLDTVLSTINTDNNELGPYIKELSSYNYLFFYASDTSGDLDIQVVQYTKNSDASNDIVYGPAGVDKINSSFDDAYPTLDSTYLYFCSNRNGQFDIYRINHTLSSSSFYNLTDVTNDVEVQVVSGLSSESDDKCPFIYEATIYKSEGPDFNEKYLVFTSNRAGGYGGYDLWYSVYNENINEWSTPANFGSSINTAYDEYRPIVKYVNGFSNRLMIFSSNRPGGKGGYDLYYVGVFPED